MASKQTRRSISVRGTTYALLRDFCAEHDRSMSDVVEELLGRILESGGAQPAAKKTVAPLVARAPQRPQQEPSRPVAKPEGAHQVDRAAVRVSPLPKAPEPAPAPVPRAAIPPRPPVNTPARPVPVASAGRPAPTPAEKVKGTQRSDYRAIRF